MGSNFDRLTCRDRFCRTKLASLWSAFWVDHEANSLWRLVATGTTDNIHLNFASFKSLFLVAPCGRFVNSDPATQLRHLDILQTNTDDSGALSEPLSWAEDWVLLSAYHYLCYILIFMISMDSCLVVSRSSYIWTPLRVYFLENNN